jgi:adenosylmethionine-8-amino-7-oxononanoate aminotransferase
MVNGFLHPFAKPTRTDFVRIVRGRGALVWDSDGNEYVDGMASLWYCNVGHGRAEIAAAIAAQIDKIEAYSCFDPFSNEPAEELAEVLLAHSPVADGRVFFCGSGSEAVDTAMKLARLAHVQAGHPEKTLIISRERGYHGTNYGGTSAQGIAPNRVGYSPLVPDVVQVPSDDLEAVSTLMASRSGEIAAVLVEPVQGAGGVYPPSDGYLNGLRKLCDQHGAFLIFDEVISGFGRLGTWFAAHHYDIRPDMVTFAKAVTSGYQPLGGVYVGSAVRTPLEADTNFFLRTGYTYSGHPTVCAAALENIRIVEREDLFTRAHEIGNRLRDGFEAMARDGIIDHVRSVGAVLGVGLPAGRDCATVRDALLKKGVITRAINTDTNTFCPPLVIKDSEIDRILDAYASVMS